MGLFSAKLEKGVLHEQVFTESAVPNVDSGIIPGVKVLGRNSQRGRVYTDEAMRTAAPLYEGAIVNIDHPDEKHPTISRGLLEGWGVLKNVTVGSDGVMADLHYLAEHPATPVLLERIKKGFPIGLSHNADGSFRRKGGKTIVESIGVVRSVDLVSKPATNSTLFESETPDMKTTTVRSIFTAHKSRYPKMARLLEEMMADPIMADAVTEAPVEETASPEDQMKEAFKAAIVAAFEDDSLDMQATLDKIKEVLASYETVKSEAAIEDPAPTEEAAVTESIAAAVKAGMKPLLEQLGKLDRKVAMRDLLDSRGIAPASLGSQRLTLLESQKDVAAMEALIESWPPAVTNGYRPAQPSNRNQNKDQPLPRLIDLRR